MVLALWITQYNFLDRTQMEDASRRVSEAHACCGLFCTRAKMNQDEPLDEVHVSWSFEYHSFPTLVNADAWNLPDECDLDEDTDCTNCDSDPLTCFGNSTLGLVILTFPSRYNC